MAVGGLSNGLVNHSGTDPRKMVPGQIAYIGGKPYAKDTGGGNKIVPIDLKDYQNRIGKVVVDGKTYDYIISTSDPKGFSNNIIGSSTKEPNIDAY